MGRQPRRAAALLLGLLVEVGAEARAAPPGRLPDALAEPGQCLRPGAGRRLDAPWKTVWETTKGPAAENHSLSRGPVSAPVPNK